MSILDLMKKRLEEAAEKAKENFSTPDEREARLDICRACDKFISLTTQCRECGCLLRAKVSLKNSTCPLGKW